MDSGVAPSMLSVSYCGEVSSSSICVTAVVLRVLTNDGIVAYFASYVQANNEAIRNWHMALKSAAWHALAESPAATATSFSETTLSTATLISASCTSAVCIDMTPLAKSNEAAARQPEEHHEMSVL
jgi:hypothetical protein